MSEQWLPCRGYEATYEVSSYGRVRSVERRVPGRDGSTRRLQGQLLQPRRRDDGALAVNLWNDNAYKQKLIHRLVLEAFDRPQPRGAEAVHINGKNNDNRRENLKWAPVSVARRQRALRMKLMRH